MIKIKRTTILVLTFSVAICTFWACQKDSSTAKTVVLRYAHVGVENEPQTRYAAELADLVREHTAGKIKITVFPNSQLGNTSEMVDAVKTGSIAMAHHDFASVGKLYPDISVFNAPYIYRNSEHALRATNPQTSPVLKELNQRLIEKAGIRIIGSFYRGARQLTANFPVYSPADLRGKKIRGVPLKIWMSMIEGMGAIPTAVEFPELATALMTGLVAGQENPLTNIYAARLYEVQSYIMITNHMQSVLCVFVNEKVWQKIAEDDRVIIEGIISEMAERSLRWVREADNIIIAELKAKGITIIEEKDGLNIEAFRKAVLEKIEIDFPNWTGYIERIRAIE